MGNVGNSHVEAKLEAPAIYKAYFPGLFFREYPHSIWPYMFGV